MQPPPHGRDNARSAVDVIVRKLRHHIAEGGLTVGDRLPTERELCSQFSASRNTVREAMRILKAYGLVDIRPKVGATVADNRMSQIFELLSFNTLEISKQTFADVQTFRRLLEIGPVEQLFEALTADDIAEMRALNVRLKDVDDIDEASELDFEFHYRLVSVLENQTVMEVYNLLKPIIMRIMEIGKTRRTFQTETYSEHETVIQALEARDRLAFQYRLSTHLMKGLQHFGGQMKTGL
jgi:DNA-binding FadR family transcriptional regulator